MSRVSVFAAVLAALLMLLGTRPHLQADDVMPTPAANESDNSAEVGTAQYVRQALGKPVNLIVMDATLNDVVEDLGKQTGLTIHIDASGLDSVGLLAEDLKVSKNLKGLSLRSVLRNVLRQMELTYTYYEGVLMITTPEVAESELLTAIYEVVDLIGKDGSRPEDYDYDSLIELIVSTVAPVSWDEVGGPGSISAYRGTVVVSQTVETHEDIAQLLAAARRAKRIAAEHRDKAPPVTSIRLSDSVSADANAAIEKALETTATFDFKDKPLDNVVEALGKEFKIPIEINDRALAEVGISTDTPITISVKNVKLGQGLRLMLRDLALTYYAGDGVLTITTAEEYELHLVTRAYPILDMVDKAPAAFGSPLAHASSAYDYDSLIELTTRTIAPETWDEVGGPGSLQVMDAHGFFVISQTHGVHEQIEKFYTDLRQTVPDKAKRAAKQQGDGQVRLAVYVLPTYGPKEKADAEDEVKGKPLPRFGGGGFGAGGFGAAGGGFGGGRAIVRGPVPDEEELLDLITTLIEPESWRTRDDVFARAVTGRLVIRHTQAVHDQIRQLAARLAIPNFREISASPHLHGGF